MAYTSLKDAFLGLQATQQPKDLFGVHSTSPMPSPPDMATAFDDNIMGAQYDPFSVDQYMPTLTDDEGFIPVAKKLPKGKDPVTGKIIYEEHYTVGFGDYGPHVKKGETRTKKEDLPRFKERVKMRMPYLKKTFPNFSNLTFGVRNSMVSSNYRGSLPDSPNTIGFIQEGNFKEAAKEFLLNNEYRDAENNPAKRGIRKRMERLSNELLKLSKQK